MIRLNIVVEGQTEETFSKEVLGNHLLPFYVLVSARRVSHVRKGAVRGRGGIKSFEDLRRDLHAWTREDQGDDARFTTMVDLYRYPKDAPNRAKAGALPDPYDRVRCLEEGLQAEIGDPRLIPYIQLHEFETILLTKRDGWDKWFLDNPDGVDALFAEVSRHSNVELINEGAATAPSKRVTKHIPLYDKVSAGTLIALEHGIPEIREHCRHFNTWLTALEQLAGKGRA